jgi:two-component system LytT family sensor kinase
VSQEPIFTAMNNKLIRWGHITFWLLLLCSDAIPDFLSKRFHDAGQTLEAHFSLLDYLLIALAYTLIEAFCFYSSYFFVGSLLHVKEKVIRAILNAVGIFLSTVALRYVAEFYFLKTIMGFDNYKGFNPDPYYYFRNVFFFYMPSYFTYGIMYFFVENWVKTSQREQEILKEKLAAELAMLRSQINPHYLFNTINDIYTLTYQKADEAPQALLKLSEMLRYMLREGQTDKMPLEREIIYLENMIELQRISAKGNANIEFKVRLERCDVEVPSLLFIAFVENAFKHGRLDSVAHPVSINLETEAGLLNFNCSNIKAPGLKDQTGGIGLQNVQRRLELLYPGKHELKIFEYDNLYKVDLTLDLT